VLYAARQNRILLCPAGPLEDLMRRLEVIDLDSTAHDADVVWFGIGYREAGRFDPLEPIEENQSVASDSEECARKACLTTSGSIHVGHLALCLRGLDEIQAQELVIERKIFFYIGRVVRDGHRHLRKPSWSPHQLVNELDRHAVGIMHGEDAIIDLARNRI